MGLQSVLRQSTADSLYFNNTCTPTITKSPRSSPAPSLSAPNPPLSAAPSPQPSPSPSLTPASTPHPPSPPPSRPRPLTCLTVHPGPHVLPAPSSSSLSHAPRSAPTDQHPPPLPRVGHWFLPLPTSVGTLVPSAGPLYLLPAPCPTPIPSGRSPPPGCLPFPQFLHYFTPGPTASTPPPKLPLPAPHSRVLLRWFSPL